MRTSACRNGARPVRAGRLQRLDSVVGAAVAAATEPALYGREDLTLATRYGRCFTRAATEPALYGREDAPTATCDTYTGVVPQRSPPCTGGKTFSDSRGAPLTTTAATEPALYGREDPGEPQHPVLVNPAATEPALYGREDVDVR